MNKKTILLIGDSVTDCGRKRPIGIGANALGDGYVSRLHQMLKNTDKADEFTLINMGVSGNTIKDLNNRWETDVLNLQPDWLSIMIGVNDVWRQFDSPNLPSISTLDEYEKHLSNLVLTTRDALEKIILITPFLVEPNHSDPMRRMVDDYVNVVRQVARREELVLIDIQEKFDMVMRNAKPQDLAGDRIHPTNLGHQLIAKMLMDSLFNN